MRDNSLAQLLASMATIYGVASAAGPLFQARMIFRRRSSDDISLPVSFMFLGSYLIWLAYGIATMDWPLMIVDSLGFVTSAGCIAMVLLFRSSRQSPQMAEALDDFYLAVHLPAPQALSEASLAALKLSMATLESSMPRVLSVPVKAPAS